MRKLIGICIIAISFYYCKENTKLVGVKEFDKVDTIDFDPLKNRIVKKIYLL